MVSEQSGSPECTEVFCDEPITGAALMLSRRIPPALNTFVAV